MPVSALPITRVALMRPGVQGFKAADYYRAQATGAISTTTATVTKPTGTVNGDLMVVGFANANTTVTTVPTGWTLVEEILHPGLNYARMYWKVASGEGASWDWVFGASGGSWVSLTYKGSAASNKEASATATVNSGTTLTAASVTTLGADRLLVLIGTTGGTKTHTEGTTMTERLDTGNPALYVYDQVVAASGATGTRTITLSVSGNSGVITAAYKYE